MSPIICVLIMNSKLIIYVISVLSFQWTLVDSVKTIDLTYDYKKQGEILKPVCVNKYEHVVPEGEEVVINLVKGEQISFAHCSFQYNTTFSTIDSFQTCCDSNVYHAKLKYVMSEPYNCTFFVLKDNGKHFEPTAVFNNVTYVQISCIFKIKLYREQPILLTAEVNGETLIPSRKSIDNVVKSEYKYNNAQKFMVICKKHGSTKGIVDLTIPAISQPAADSKLPITKAQFEINNPRVLGPYFTMRCRLRDNNTTLEVYNIDFTPKKAANEIDVEGLSISNIIENKDDSRYLYYKYTDIEEVNFKCSMDCQNEYCLMEMWINERKLNFTQWIYGTKTSLSQILLLTPGDNSTVIKCVGFRKPATDILTQYIYVTFLYANEEIKTTLRPNACVDGKNTLNSYINCTSDGPKHQNDSTPSSEQNTLPATSPKISPTTSPTILLTTIPTNSLQSSTAPDFPKYFGWLIASVILVLAVIVLIVYVTCMRRRRSKNVSQRPQQPLPELPVQLDTFPSASNQEQHEYEEIPPTVTRPVTPNVRQLRRIPDMRLDRQNNKLIVKGKAIDLQKLLREAEYVETK